MRRMIKEALGDAIMTFIWVFSAPSLGLFTTLIASFLGIQARSITTLFLTTIIATAFILVFSLISKLLGNASFNPSTTASFYTAGLSPGTSLILMAVRFPAQTAGGVGGAKAIMHFMPRKFRDFVKGRSLKVDMKSGAIAEGLFTFSFCFALLWVILKGPKNPILQVWMLSVATVGLVVVGSGYTGPSMNPANAIGWAYVNGWHNSWELFIVYWIGPLVGAVLAARVFQFLFHQPEMKEKKA